MKRRLMALVLTCTLVSSFVGCGNTSDTATEVSSSSVESSAPESKETETSQEEPSAYEVTEPISIEFWCAYGEEAKYSWWADCVDRFNASQNLITVNMVQISGYAETDKQITAAQAAQTGLPAVSLINYPRVLTYANSGMLEPLNEFVDETGYDISDFYDGLVNPLILDSDNQLYGLPAGASGACYYFNQDMIDSLDLEIPETWEEMKTFAKAVYDATGNAGFGFMSELNYVEVLMRTSACDPLGDGVTSDMMNEKLISWLSEMKEMVDAGYMTFYNGADYSGDIQNDFYNGKVAAIQHTSSIAAMVCENSDFTVGARAQMKGSEETLSTAAGAAFIIPAANEQPVKNAAWQFIQYALNEENMTEWSIVGSVYPAKKSVLESNARLESLYAQYPLIEDIYAGMDNLVSKNKTPYQTAAYKVLLNAMGQIIYDNADLESTWAAAAEEVDGILSGN